MPNSMQYSIIPLHSFNENHERKCWLAHCVSVIDLEIHDDTWVSMLRVHAVIYSRRRTLIVCVIPARNSSAERGCGALQQINATTMCSAGDESGPKRGKCWGSLLEQNEGGGGHALQNLWCFLMFSPQKIKDLKKKRQSNWSFFFVCIKSSQELLSPWFHYQPALH